MLTCKAAQSLGHPARLPHFLKVQRQGTTCPRSHRVPPDRTVAWSPGTRPSALQMATGSGHPGRPWHGHLPSGASAKSPASTLARQSQIGPAWTLGKNFPGATPGQGLGKSPHPPTRKEHPHLRGFPLSQTQCFPPAYTPLGSCSPPCQRPPEPLTSCLRTSSSLSWPLRQAIEWEREIKSEP